MDVFAQQQVARGWGELEDSCGRWTRGIFDFTLIQPVKSRLLCILSHYALRFASDASSFEHINKPISYVQLFSILDLKCDLWSLVHYFDLVNLSLVIAFELKRRLDSLVVPLPLGQKGMSPGAENVFRSPPLALARKPSDHSAHSSAWSWSGWGGYDGLRRVQLRRACSWAHGLATTHATFAAQLPSAVVDTGLKSIWNGSILALMAFKNSNDWGIFVKSIGQHFVFIRCDLAGLSDVSFFGFSHYSVLIFLFSFSASWALGDIVFVTFWKRQEIWVYVEFITTVTRNVVLKFLWLYKFSEQSDSSIFLSWFKSLKFLVARWFSIDSCFE